MSLADPEDGLPEGVPFPLIEPIIHIWTCQNCGDTFLYNIWASLDWVKDHIEGSCTLKAIDKG